MEPLCSTGLLIHQAGMNDCSLTETDSRLMQSMLHSAEHAQKSEGASTAHFHGWLDADFLTYDASYRWESFSCWAGFANYFTTSKRAALR